MILINCVFAALIAVSSAFGSLHFWNDSDGAVIFYTVNSVVTMLPAILLIVSVCIIKKLIKILGGSFLSSRDCLMQAHTAVFLFYLFAYICDQCMVLAYYLKEDPSAPINFTYECRNNFSDDIFTYFMELTSMATLILLAYMSIKFSQPVPDYIPDFLNKYENDHIISSPRL